MALRSSTFGKDWKQAPTGCFYMSRRLAPKNLSQRMVDRIQPDQWVSENLGYGHGSLQVRGTPTGGRYYLRTGKGRSRLPLGAAKGRDRVTLDEARRRAWAASADQAHRALPQGALGALLEAYCDTLAQNGSNSETSTRAMLHRHVRDTHPQLWLQPAPSVLPEQIVGVLDLLVADGKIATAGKLRTSLNAAFNRALRADLCARSPLMRGFGLIRNPVTLIASLSPPRSTPERVLTIHELRALWRALNDVDTPTGAILRFYLLTGGQRVTQLLRARREDLVAGGVMLYDPKGRRTEARPHLVPIIDAARDTLDAIPGEEPSLLALKPVGWPRIQQPCFGASSQSHKSSEARAGRARESTSRRFAGLSKRNWRLRVSRRPFGRTFRATTWVASRRAITIAIRTSMKSGQPSKRFFS
ncbi:MAG: hypothetical protein U5L08_07560 [Xanthomonadales bacterium]|nr:hypothetical protein [Xanthomonadales bacterium]